MASALGHGAKLASVLADINAHHYAVAGPENPTPLWLKDMCVTPAPQCARGAAAHPHRNICLDGGQVPSWCPTSWDKTTPCAVILRARAAG